MSMRTKTQRFDFQTACTAMLKELGAVEDPAGYGLLLNTIAGGLQCTPYDNWLATRFNDVHQAKAKVYSGSLNPFSGKWNWHCAHDKKPTQADVDDIRAHLERVVVKCEP